MTKKKKGIIELLWGIYIFDLAAHTILTPGQSASVIWPTFSDLGCDHLSCAGSRSVRDYFRAGWVITSGPKERTRECFHAQFQFSVCFAVVIPSFFFSQFSSRAVLVGMWKAAAIKASIVLVRGGREKTHIVIHINFQLFYLGSNGEVPFVWTSSKRHRRDRKKRLLA